MNILTRGDFDGLTSSVLLTEVETIRDIRFAHPKDCQDGLVEVEPDDIVVNLPYIKGCAACHGRDAEGAGIAPALVGHSANQVRRQVRAPVGLMPVFPPDKVTNEDLGEIAGFIESLRGGHLHQRPTAVADALAQHHWMALFALEDESGEEAAHHIDHINPLVTGDHLARMQESLRLIEEGDLHDAAHLIEGMIAGTAAPDLTEPAMHLRLALSAAAVEEPADARHHLEHFLASSQPNSPEAENVDEAIALLEAGESTEAGHVISGLVGEVNEEHHDDGEEEEPENHGDEEKQ